MNSRTLRAISLFICGGWCAIVVYMAYHDLSVYGAMPAFVVGAIGIILFLRAIYKDIRDYQHTQERTSFVPSATGALFLIITLGFMGMMERRLHTPTLIEATLDGDLSRLAIDFKQDGTYVVNDSDLFSQRYSYGTYTIAGHIITLDVERINDFLCSKTLAVESPYLTQLDSAGEEMDTYKRMKISKDFRTMRR